METLDTGDRMLVICQTVITDRGTYRCVIQNKLGKATSTGLLNIKDSGGSVKSPGRLKGRNCSFVLLYLYISTL